MNVVMAKGRRYIGLNDELPYGCITNDPQTKHIVDKDANPNECHSLNHQRPTVRVELPKNQVDEDGSPSTGWEIIDTRDLPANYFHEGGSPKRPVTKQEQAKQITRLVLRRRQWFRSGYAKDGSGKVIEIASGPTLDQCLTGQQKVDTKKEDYLAAMKSSKKNR